MDFIISYSESIMMAFQCGILVVLMGIYWEVRKHWS